MGILHVLRFEFLKFRISESKCIQNSLTMRMYIIEYSEFRCCYCYTRKDFSLVQLTSVLLLFLTFFIWKPDACIYCCYKSSYGTSNMIETHSHTFTDFHIFMNSCQGVINLEIHLAKRQNFLKVYCYFLKIDSIFHILHI